jgi:hypothetical protein
MGNPLGTRRELSENTLGTRKDEKKILSPPHFPQNLNRKKARHLECMLKWKL